MPRWTNILDPIQRSLSPLVWDAPASPSPSLHPNIARFVTQHIYGVLEDGGYTDPHQWLRLYFTGSLCTYQYSETSDADVSLSVLGDRLPEWSRAEMIGLMITGCDGIKLPDTPYEIQAYVVARGIQPMDLFKPGLRAGYSIDDHEWVSPPDRNLAHDVRSQENGFYMEGLQAADKMERMLRYEPDKAVDYWHQIHRRRMRDQKMGKGDASESNIVYKFLAQRGLLPKLEESDQLVPPTHAQFRSQAYKHHALHGRTAAVADPIPYWEARGNSRPVTPEEFDALAEEGRQRYMQMIQNRQPTYGMDQNWDGIKRNAYREVLKPWGGMTIHPGSGLAMPDGSDQYALTARPHGMPPVRIAENPSYQEFEQAMEQARERYADVLQREGHHLGIFHDDDEGSVDIDPTLIVPSPHDVETIGAYTHNIGGAYHFATGNGYFPPHVGRQYAEPQVQPQAPLAA